MFPIMCRKESAITRFYNPTMYKETTTQAPSIYGLVQEDQDPLSFAQVRMHVQLKDEFDGEYKKSQASGGIIQMLDQMIGDVEAEMAEAKRDEEDGQSEYEETMADATAKRATDQKLIVTKEAAKALLAFAGALKCFGVWWCPSIVSRRRCPLA